MIERILGWFGIFKCHYCKRYILPWQGFCGKIRMQLICDGKEHPLVANYITHAGECTEKDIKRTGERGK